MRTAFIVAAALALASCHDVTTNGKPATPKPKQQAAMTYRYQVRQHYPFDGFTTVEGYAVITNVGGPKRTIEAHCTGRKPDGSGLIIFADRLGVVELPPGQSEEALIYGQTTRPGPVVVECAMDPDA